MVTRQCEAACHEHHDAKASHEGFVQTLFERPSLLSNNLRRHLRFGQLRYLGIQSDPNFYRHLQPAKCASSADLKTSVASAPRSASIPATREPTLLMTEAVPKCCSLTAPMILKRKYPNPKWSFFGDNKRTAAGRRYFQPGTYRQQGQC